MPNQKIISWKFPEYTSPERSRSWYFWAILFFLGLLLYSVLTANFLFGLIIIIFTIILFMHHHKEPQEIKAEISDDGVKIGERLYDFKEIKKFWLIYEPPEVKNLYLDFDSFFRPTLVIPLLNENPLAVRDFLKEYVTEDLEKESESTSAALARVLKI